VGYLSPSPLLPTLQRWRKWFPPNNRKFHWIDKGSHLTTTPTNQSTVGSGDSSVAMTVRLYGRT